MRQAHDAIAHYHRSFRPSAALAEPYAMLAVTAVCGSDDDHAQRLAGPIRVAVAKNRTGRRGPIVTPEEAAAYQFSDDERAIVEEFLMGAVIGGPARIAERLQATAREAGAQELMLSTLVPDLAERQASLERISAALA
jgi:alkanesulfonate monooxygenase SsuD/methylene tetrahydromethanopterin reductase-like flavin-dependent oxidoreductase (luciferase family)